jgi:hypothetical protein
MKPIIFSTLMVQAILDGRKTQTRRVVKPQPVKDDTFKGPYWYEPTVVNKDGELGPGKPVFGISSTDGEWGIKSPYRPGDVLYVRETWSRDESGEYVYRTNYGTTEDDSFPPSMFRWRPSIHMPREAARIFLLVKDVRVERLQDITEEDAIAEGIRIGIGGEPYFSCRDAFVALWNSINTKRGYGWGTNPWVWVVSFERISKDEAYKKEGLKC